jgi:hypothetical protein
MILAAQEASALEYHVAKTLNKEADARTKKAIAAAIKTGALFDHLKEPMEPGTAQVIYSGRVVEISVAVGYPIAGVDHDGFVETLLAGGVKPALIKRAAAKHATATCPAHRFTSSLVAG